VSIGGNFKPVINNAPNVDKLSILRWLRYFFNAERNRRYLCSDF